MCTEESGSTYAIGWQGQHRIDGDTFLFEDNRFRPTNAIRGYPVKELQSAIGAS